MHGEDYIHGMLFSKIGIQYLTEIIDGFPVCKWFFLRDD